MKKSKRITLFVAPMLGSVLFGACGDADPDEPATRDVYQSREECLNDWNDGELCTQMNDEERDYYERDSGHRHGVFFWGPLYYASSRSVMYKGKTYTPASKSSALKPFSVTSRAPSSSRTGVSSPRGGFGGKSSSGS